MYDYIRTYWDGERYLIPFQKMGKEVSGDVISLLSDTSVSGKCWVLMRGMSGNYVVSLVSRDILCFEYYNTFNAVYEVCRKYQLEVRMVSSISISKYFSNVFLQKVLDMLLHKCNVDCGGTLGLIDGNRGFVLVEVR